MSTYIFAWVVLCTTRIISTVVSIWNPEVHKKPCCSKVKKNSMTFISYASGLVLEAKSSMSFCHVGENIHLHVYFSITSIFLTQERWISIVNRLAKNCRSTHLLSMNTIDQNVAIYTFTATYKNNINPLQSVVGPCPTLQHSRSGPSSGIAGQVLLRLIHVRVFSLHYCHLWKSKQTSYNWVSYFRIRMDGRWEKASNRKGLSGDAYHVCKTG